MHPIQTCDPNVDRISRNVVLRYNVKKYTHNRSPMLIELRQPSRFRVAATAGRGVDHFCWQIFFFLNAALLNTKSSECHTRV